MFICFPRWIDELATSVAEVAANGTLLPYPNELINTWDQNDPASAGGRLVCVQAIVVSSGALWILDPASPDFVKVVPGGPKLLKVNLATDTVERVYCFDDDAAPPNSYLNDVRFAKDFAFITDSGLGALVVLNLATGNVRRLLEDDQSTKAEAWLEPVIGGRPWRFANGKTPQVHSDGIAIDPEQKYVYYKALTGRTLYRVPIGILLDETLQSGELGNHVERVKIVGPTDGLDFDANGNLYLTGLEENAIKMLRPDGRLETFATAPEFLWPDTIVVKRSGDLFFSASQFHLMPAFNENIDRRMPPYKVFHVQLLEASSS